MANARLALLLLLLTAGIALFSGSGIADGAARLSPSLKVLARDDFISGFGSDGSRYVRFSAGTWDVKRSFVLDTKTGRKHALPDGCAPTALSDTTPEVLAHCRYPGSTVDRVLSVYGGVRQEVPTLDGVRFIALGRYWLYGAKASDGTGPEPSVYVRRSDGEVRVTSDALHEDPLRDLDSTKLTPLGPAVTLGPTGQGTILREITSPSTSYWSLRLRQHGTVRTIRKSCRPHCMWVSYRAGVVSWIEGQTTYAWRNGKVSKWTIPANLMANPFDDLYAVHTRQRIFIFATIASPPSFKPTDTIFQATIPK